MMSLQVCLATLTYQENTSFKRNAAGLIARIRCLQGSAAKQIVQQSPLDGAREHVYRNQSHLGIL